jgi:hypothetical protein
MLLFLLTVRRRYRGIWSTSIIERSVQGQGCQLVYFQTKNLSKSWEDLRMEKYGMFYGHLEYFTAILKILRSFGNVVMIWYIFHRFGICVKKNLATLVQARFEKS